MVAISLSGSGEGSGWVTAPGYSTATHDASEGDHRGQPLPRPSSTLIRASGTMMLCDEGLNAHRRAHEE